MSVSWYIGFTARPRKHWFDVFTSKNFRHVLALSYDPACEVWLYYDVGLNGTYIDSFPKGSPVIAALIAEVPRWLKTNVRQTLYPRGLWRFYCVPAIKSLVGLKSCALTPKGLYRDLVKAGAIPAFETRD